VKLLMETVDKVLASTDPKAALSWSNPKTGKSVRVTVNDRGPFTPGLTLDLSHGAARAIGMRSTQAVTMRRC